MENKSNKIFNVADIRKEKMMSYRQKGLSYGSISALFGITRARVHQIISGYHTNLDKNEKKLRKYIFNRDSWTCQFGDVCHSKKTPRNKLVIHHIDFNDRNNKPQNLLTMCRMCHSGFHATNFIDDATKKRFNDGWHPPVEKINKICKHCGVEFLVVPSNHRKYCTKECGDTDPNRRKNWSKERLKIYNSERAKIYNQLKKNMKRLDKHF